MGLIYFPIHEWLIFVMIHVGKYTSPMDPKRECFTLEICFNFKNSERVFFPAHDLLLFKCPAGFNHQLCLFIILFPR